MQMKRMMLMMACAMAAGCVSRGPLLQVDGVATWTKGPDFRLSTTVMLGAETIATNTIDVIYQTHEGRVRIAPWNTGGPTNVSGWIVFAPNPIESPTEVKVSAVLDAPPTLVGHKCKKTIEIDEVRTTGPTVPPEAAASGVQ
jgi:hypothetical protein